jgi:hypothetical protein
MASDVCKCGRMTFAAPPLSFHAGTRVDLVAVPGVLTALRQASFAERRLSAFGKQPGKCSHLSDTQANAQRTTMVA